MTLVNKAFPGSLSKASPSIAAIAKDVQAIPNPTDADYMAAMLKKLGKNEQLKFLDFIALRVEAQNQARESAPLDSGVELNIPLKVEIMVRRWARIALSKARAKILARHMLLNDTIRSGADLASEDIPGPKISFDNVRSGHLRLLKIRAYEKRAKDIAPLLRGYNFKVSPEERAKKEPPRGRPEFGRKRSERPARRRAVPEEPGTDGSVPGKLRSGTRIRSGPRARAG